MQYRNLPSVESVMATRQLQGLAILYQRDWLVGLVRQQIADARDAIRRGEDAASIDDIAVRVAQQAARQARPRPQPVINATGVIIHTNLGRAPLSEASVDAMHDAADRYTDLELDIDLGPSRFAPVPPSTHSPPPYRGRIRPGRQQQRFRRLSRPIRHSPRKRCRRLPWRGGGNRRRFPRSRCARPERCPAGGSRHHQPHLRLRLRVRHHPRNRRPPQSPRQQLPCRGLHPRLRYPRTGRFGPDAAVCPSSTMSAAAAC